MADGGDFRYHYQPHLLLHQHHLPQQQRQRQPPRAPPRQRPSARPGEIVEVQGGHILRATGRKDRHSKVCTAKGPRDRRVRLSAHTAIQFYDVQDRLGYDRPSKAVDWLIKHAKSAIDELASLPSWRPPDPDPHAHQQQQVREQDPSPEQSFAIVPPSLESDAIADTIKLFFPVSGSQASSSHSNAAGDGNNVVGYPQQDLRLSLQPHGNPSPEQALFPQGWVEQSPPCVAHWGGAGGYIYSVPEQVVMVDGSALSQRCPLQSNGSDASIRGWMDVSTAAAYHPPGPNASSFGLSGLPGFHVPARIHGEDDQQRGSSVALPLHLLDGAGRKDGRR